MSSIEQAQQMPQIPLPQTADQQQGEQQPDAQQLMMAIAGNTHGGAIPQRPGGEIHQQYPGLRAMGHVDWRQVNPRLLSTLDKEAQKRGFTIVLQSGYRDHDTNHRQGGHPTCSHKRGVSVDAFVAGHPLGEVVGPDELSRLGMTVGGPNGDPSHVELTGIPMKKPPAPKKQKSGPPAPGQSKAGPFPQPQVSQGMGPPMRKPPAAQGLGALGGLLEGLGNYNPVEGPMRRAQQ